MSTENNTLFITASRKKFRFETAKGLLSAEDLWDLNLNSLDAIAVALDDKIQKLGRKSFVAKRAASTSDLNDQLEILKFVIGTKIAEDEQKKVKADKESQKAFLNTLLEKKKTEQMEGLSVEEIQKQLASLQD